MDLTRHEIDAKGMKETAAAETDYDVLIDEPTLGYENGKLVFVYMKPPDTDRVLSRAREACFSLKFKDVNWRSDGLQSVSRIFGFQPRLTTRKDYCAPTVMARESPAEQGALLDMGKVVARIYEQYNPELYKAHCELIEETVEPDWRLPGMPFSGGIVNKNNPIHYHFDSANIPNVWSCLLCFKQDLEGGYLAVPQYNIAAAFRDGWIGLFDNKQFLHGVTPFNKISPEATRFTVVYYSNQGMRHCLPCAEEISRIKNKRTEREDKRNQGVDPVTEQ